MISDTCSASVRTLLEFVRKARHQGSGDEARPVRERLSMLWAGTGLLYVDPLLDGMP